MQKMIPEEEIFINSVFKKLQISEIILSPHFIQKSVRSTHKSYASLHADMV